MIFAQQLLAVPLLLVICDCAYCFCTLAAKVVVAATTFYKVLLCKYIKSLRVAAAHAFIVDERQVTIK